ncbi:MAG: hypothetical protein ABMA25_07295 [Ilumatobacteraceae bacterium]
MSIDDHLEAQLAEYFGWLEGHLGTTMRSAEVAPRRPRRRLALLGVAAAVVALAAVALVVRNDDAPSIGPATSPVIDPTLPSTAPTTGSTNTTASTAPEPIGELTWAPLALPPTMELVDARRSVLFEGWLGRAHTATQAFVRLAPDGTTVEAQLILSVEPANPDVTSLDDITVHGQPAVIYRDEESAITSIWWAENGHIVTGFATGFDSNELMPLLEATQWRADRTTGFEPASIGQGLTPLYEAQSLWPDTSSSFVVHDTTVDSYIHVDVDRYPNSRPMASVRQTEFGLVLTSADGNFIGLPDTTLLTADGEVAHIGGPFGATISPEQGVAIAAAMRPATADELGGLQQAANASLTAAPSAGSFVLGSYTLTVRGDATEPVALCIRGASGSSCSYNDVRRDGSSRSDVSNTSVLLDDTWFITGYGLGFRVMTEGQTDTTYPMQFCSANADGSLIALLPAERMSAVDREYFLVAVPDDVGFVRVCIDVDGELRPNSTGVTVRPLP